MVLTCWTHSVFQLLLEKLLFPLEEGPALFFYAQLCRQLIALILHPVQLDLQSVAQFLIRCCICLIQHTRVQRRRNTRPVQVLDTGAVHLEINFTAFYYWEFTSIQPRNMYRV